MIGFHAGMGFTRLGPDSSEFSAAALHERVFILTANTLFQETTILATLGLPPTHPHREQVPGRPQAPVLFPSISQTNEEIRTRRHRRIGFF